MQISAATVRDAASIKNIYLQAFDSFEASLVSDVAVNLLSEKHPVRTISLVAIENHTIVGHVAFSPVHIEGANEHLGYILAPLAVAPKFQHNKIGSSLVTHGLAAISGTDSCIVFVYGDPHYYSRFGFNTHLAKNFIPPYPLKFPEGWQALKVNSALLPECGKISCVSSLNNPNLW